MAWGGDVSGVWVGRLGPEGRLRVNSAKDSRVVRPRVAGLIGLIDGVAKLEGDGYDIFGTYLQQKKGKK